ncbi:hypothetical protein, partial [Streptococcus pneumoniae]|uniref:hypothetical protein n=1 Tax=Streptococcus pneumoniae TaxID=1313 RepID=UPI001E3BA875
MCKLEEDLRPDDTSITLTCTACTAPIRKGNTYGILVNTNLIYCASCSVNPIIVDEPKPLAFVNPAAQPRPSLLPGQWSRNHARCI